MIPYEDTVTEAQNLIDRVIAGEMLESSYDKEATDINDPVYVEPTPTPEPEPEEPEITGTIPTISFDSDTITIYQGQSYDLMTGVTVRDIEDELLYLSPIVTTDITDTSVLAIGNYTITYTVTDSDGNTITANRTLTVLQDISDEIPDEEIPEDPIKPPDETEDPIVPEDPIEPPGETEDPVVPEDPIDSIIPGDPEVQNSEPVE